MAVIQLPNEWVPRKHQMRLWTYLEGGGKRAAAVWHRRAGKDSVALNWTATAAHQRVGTYWHMLPTQTQGRKTIWDGIDRHGRRMIDQAFPEVVRTNYRKDEMKIELKCGSIWQVVGSDNYNNLIGSNPVGVVFSEYSVADPAAWDYIRPILAENGGWAVFIYTARGRNHGALLYEMARDNPSWFAQILTVDDTGVIGPEVIQEERDSGMSDDMIAQEYYCSFQAAISGSYYGKQMVAAEKDGRICEVPYEPNIRVETWWDLGVGDSTAIWFVQRSGREIRVIDYYEMSGEGLPHYAKVLQTKDYVYSRHIAPHDIEVRELGTGKSRRETAAALGIKFQVAPNLAIDDGIDAMRAMLARCWFDKRKTARLIEALKQYRKDWNDKLKVFQDHPCHDWTSHCFTGETKILTRHGMYRIMDLPETGEVLTPCGWNVYRNPRITRKDAQLVEVAFIGGYSVNCTPDHLFLTASGWKSARDLQRGMQIQSTLTLSRSISMVASTVCGQAKAIYRAAAASYTDLPGSRPLALFLLGVTSIIETIIPSTMTFATSNASPRRSISPTLGGMAPKPYSSQTSISPMRREPEPQIGTDRMRAVYGTVATLRAAPHGRSGSERRNLAITAGSRLRHWFVIMRCRIGSALRFVRQERIAHVRPLDRVEDVWCLTVPDAECFSLANGAVVHNCADAGRYGAVTGDPKDERNAPRIPAFRNVNSGMGVLG